MSSIFNIATTTLAEVKKAQTSTLVQVYNMIQEKNKGKKIKKFSDRDTAETRTWKAIKMTQEGTVTEITKKENGHTVNGKRDESENRVIKLVVKENPKRPDSRAHKKFGILMEMDGKTVREYKEKEGKYPSLDNEKGWPATELRYSVNMGLIKLVAHN